MTVTKLFNQIFRDSTGKVVIMQWPNLPIAGWIIFKLAAHINNNQTFTDSFNGISTTFLLVWATLELTTGVNIFRKLLGLVVLVATVTHYL